MALPQWRERVDRELAQLTGDADDEAVAAAVARALQAQRWSLHDGPVELERTTCMVLLRQEPTALVLLHFARKSAVPSPLERQTAVACVHRWRERHRAERDSAEAVARHDALTALAAELIGVLDVEAIEQAAVVARDDPRWGGEWARADALLQRALATAQRSDVERRTREWLERSLLPDALLPVPGLQLASRYLPGSSNTELAGGDFYDAVRAADGSASTLIIGDVQGKGVEAATLTALARHTLRGAALRGQGPVQLLLELNAALLYGQAEEEAAGNVTPRFVTAAVATVRATADPERFRVELARAGHPPPIVVRSGGDIELIEPRGLLLGVAPHPVYEPAEVELHAGDTLLLYTDGVTEHREPAAAMFDERQLGLLVRNRRDTNRAESIAQLVLDTVLLLAPGAARDDIALLVASVAGGAN